ncbi:unnamed protein product [Cuscuta epithymum]|uniref:Uncharacterized protein n=1 Tax=Cuscuta epithymum TaxID=186058 RepID=A0AAV0E878_9ASTE|nr:unnamed protein product [Cuscuta epithymum]CAH9141214.1 unnamed protein product [Cuscuta epithymum]
MILRIPWKKGKTRTRISQFVNDQFRRNRKSAAASPLVVETGFPTSLVDLIVNHRDRFKMLPSPSLRSKQKNPPPPPPPHQPPPPDSVFVSPPQSPPPTSPILPAVPEQEIHAEIHKCESNPNGVLQVSLKVFFIGVLAITTKKFTLGLTMSAFFLFFLEYLVKQLPRFYKPCSELRESLGKEDIVSTMPENLPKIHPIHKCDGNGGSIVPETEIVERSHCDWKLECAGGRLEDIIDKDGGGRCVKSHKAAKFKSKMKILLPKKFRNLRKKLKYGEEKEEIVYIGEHGFEPRGNSDIVKVKDGCDNTSCPRESLDNSGDLCDGSGQLLNGSGNLFDSSKESMEMGKVDPIERDKNPGYMVLLVIVLLGLVGGRVFALICMLAWCFLLRGREASRRLLKVFIFRSNTNFSMFKVSMC